MSKKKLYNIYGKKQLKEQLDTESFERITCSFYNYYKIEDLEEVRNRLYHKLEDINVLGRIYLAEEGVNAQISIPKKSWNQFLALINTYDFLKNIQIKKSIQEGLSFLKLKIMIKKEIVAWGLDEDDYDMNYVGKHLNAKDFNTLIKDKDTLLIDMRNNYESEIGKFETAICPKSKRSKDLIKEVKELLKNKKEKKIAMYCTGGIRCEKASSHLIKSGFKNVFQLNGGIIEYAHQVKNENIKSKFIGKNFVFDDRLGERVTNDIIAKCHLCNNLSDTHTNCNNDACHILFIICDNCDNKLDGCCSIECQKIHHLPLEEQKKYEKSFQRNLKIISDLIFQIKLILNILMLQDRLVFLCLILLLSKHLK